MTTYTVPSVEAVTAQVRSFAAPVVKANKLTVANLEKLVSFQSELARSYVELGLARLQAAVEVNDAASLKAFGESSVETGKSLVAKLQADAKALTELLNGFKAEFTSLAKAA